MRFSEVKGRQVVDVSTAATVGQVRGFLVDAESRSIVALRLKKTDHGNVLRWGALASVGVDAVTIADPSAITEFDDELKELRGKRRRMTKKRVLSTGGDELGQVADVDFDPDTGALTRLLLDDDSEIAAERLMGIGSYAVVVRALHRT